MPGASSTVSNSTYGKLLLALGERLARCPARGQHISTRHAFSVSCRAADLLHVACARELTADLFISFDDDQVKLAKAAGLKALRPD